jgi:hypothetical protein
MDELVQVRPDSLRRFLTRWYGPFDEPEYQDAYTLTLVARHPAALEPFDRLGVPWD